MTHHPDDGFGQLATTALRRQIEDLEAALAAIRSGGVDAVLMGPPEHEQLYTLASADRPYRVIVEEMGEGAATVSSTGTVLYANLRLAALLGRDRGALLGARVSDLVPPDDRAAFDRLLAVAPASTARAELDLLHQDGSRVPALTSVTGLDIEGAVVRCLVVADLTDRRAAEAKLAAAHDALLRRAGELERTNTLLAKANDRLGAAKAELEDAQRVARVGSWVWRSEPEAVTWSPEMFGIFALDPAEGVTSFPEALASRSQPHEAADVLTAFREAQLNERAFEVEHQLRLPDGATRHVLTRGEVMRDAAGEVVGIRGTTQDVTQLREAEQALARTSAQFVAAFEHAPVGMALVSLDRTVLRANEALAAITGYSTAALAGLPLSAITEDPSPDLELFADLAAGRLEHYRCEVRVRRADAALRWAALSVARVAAGNEDYAAFHIEDISDRKGYEDRLQYLADHDPLTGLLNRRRLHEELDHALALGLRYHADGALALLDLDNFKYINDTLGHPTGDALLTAITRALSSRLRDSDVLARLGGDEFAVLLYAVDAQRAEALVRDLLQAVSEHGIATGGQRVRTTASAGIVMLDQTGGTTADEVLANADLAMYSAKASGGDGLLVYDASGPAAALSRAKFVWIDRVRRALEEDRFTLLAQPILDLAHDEIRGCELLLRMQDGDGLVEPEEFLGIAERHGLASAVDAHVVRSAIALAARLDTGPDFRWEINISGASLDDRALVEVIETELERHAVPPASLVFEITETAAIKNMSQAQAFATRVTDLGCGFALDDFGAGYGGFYYLKYLPLDYLKIDGEFIRELLTNRTNRVIVQSMVALARPLGKQTIAEYVLDEDTVDLLRELHVDHAQGYHIGTPTDPVELLARAPQPRRPGDPSRRVVDLTAAPVSADRADQRGR
jgi:diguanylate cyclase (GGDEF)-like protein/PAS domain S-box-containing protein